MNKNTETARRIEALAYLLRVSAETGDLFASGNESIVENVAAMIYEMALAIKDEQGEKQ